MSFSWQGDSGEEPRYSAMVPEYSAEWVNSTMRDFASIVKDKPPKERAQKIRAFLKTDFVEIRDVIVAQWEPTDGSFWSGEENTHDQSVYDALKMADRWRVLFIKRVNADEQTADPNGKGKA